jgi:hypothetical protein
MFCCALLGILDPCSLPGHQREQVKGVQEALNTGDAIGWMLEGVLVKA